jgi:hypothetical protein
VSGHTSPFRPPEPALISQRVGGGGRRCVAAVFDVHTSRSIRVAASRRCLHQTSLRSPADHDDSCELLPFEGGGSPNQCFGHSRTRTNANTGIPAHTPRLRLPRQATTAEFRVVDLIAQHDPETNAQLPRRRDVGFRESLLRHLPSIEALQVRIPSHCMGRRLTPEEPQKRIPLFAAHPVADVYHSSTRSGSCRRSWRPPFRREIGTGPRRRLPSPTP